MASKFKRGVKHQEKTAEELRTREHSLVFVKRMLVLSVSSITYLRGIFPEDAYHSRYLEDLCIKVLKEDSSSLGAGKIVKWMMGCFDALEKNYLQVLLIGVHRYADDINHVIESYQFKFRYTEQGPEMDVLRNQQFEMRVTIEETKKASLLLIRKMFLLMQNLDVLPDDVSLSMKLYYYDDVTPPDYEPPGFKKSMCENLWFEGTAVHFRVGDLHTPFHIMKVCIAVEQSLVNKLQVTEECSIDDSPSGHGSATEFKQSSKSIVKRKENKLTRRRKRAC